MQTIDINIFQFHGIPRNSPEVPWISLEFHETFLSYQGGSMWLHDTLKVPWNLTLALNTMEYIYPIIYISIYILQSYCFINWI